MTASVRNRLLLLGSVWGVLLVALAVLVMMTRHLTGFLVAALLCAALSGSVGTLVAGRRAVRRGEDGRGGTVLAELGTGLLQGLVGGTFAALLFWALLVLALSELSLGNPVDPSVLMSSRVFAGSFFVALSVFLYAVA